MPYVNPVPAIDIGKTFRMKLEMRFDEPIPVDAAKQKMAEYLLEQDPATLASGSPAKRSTPCTPTT